MMASIMSTALLLCTLLLLATQTEAWLLMMSAVKKRPVLREAAGAESLFSTAKAMRPSVRGRRRRRFIVRQIKKRRLERKNNNEDTIVVDSLRLERVQKTLPSWAFEDKQEEKRLATMKLLVEEDMRTFVDSTVKVGGLSLPVLEAFPDVYGDLRLLRFLRKDKEQDPVSAASRYREFLRWRKDKKIDHIRARVEGEPFRGTSSVVFEHLPCDFDLPFSSSKEKTIPIILYAGNWRTSAITKLIQQDQLSLDTFLEHWVYLFESLHRRLYYESLAAKTLVYVDEICDLEQLNMGQFSPAFVSTVLKPWLQVTQTYYPETTKRISFLNPPRILSVAWAIVSRLGVSQSTQQKVKLFPGVKETPRDFAKRVHDTQSTG